MNKRFLIFSLAYYPVEGGAEIAVKEITDRILDTEFDMVTLRFNRSHPKKEIIGNCTIYRINSSKLLFPLKAFLFASKLHKEKHYDIVWSIMAAFAGLAGLFFKIRFPSVKFVLTLQEGDSLEHIYCRMGVFRPVFKQIFKKADVVQVISNFLADFARQMGYRGKTSVIPNGVDVQKFRRSGQSRALTTGGVMLITTSRLVEKNAVGDIIEALKYLPENASLKILGTGPLENDLKFKVKSLKLENRVEFLGHISHYDISKYLHSADIFIRPSLSEGFGNSFIEAMAAGLPVIATPVGGIVDFLKPPSNSSGQVATGLFCEVHNPESIAEQVKRLIANEPLRKSLIANASRIVQERYEWDLIAREMSSKVFSKI
ncbi:MAG: glycosyltransferase [bacterium]